MIMIKPEVLKLLREKKGLSQEEVAGHVNLSRPSYVLIEKGEKDLTLSQAKIISDLYGITLDSLIKGDPTEQVEVEIKKTSKESLKKEESIRISVPQKKLDKFKEVLLYILEKVGGKPNVGMAVLYKLLYFIDFDYYEKFEDQLIGATYIKNHFGPTPVEFIKVKKQMIEHDELEEVKSKYFEKEQTKYLPHRSADLSKLTAQEVKHIDDVLARFSDKNASEMRDYSHKDVPWIVAKDGKPIEYESVFYRTGDTTVRDYDGATHNL
jgi:transcriptional regulator with XRE-family HTH domain